MSEKDFGFLLKLMDYYQEEARKCKQADAHLAGCVVLAAAMEAGLLGMAYCLDTEVRGTETFQRARDKDLRTWALKRLLDLANEMKWLPSNLPLGKEARLSGIKPDEAIERGDVIYLADVVREVRDMIHPGRYVRLWSGVKVTMEYLDSVEERVQIVYDLLYDRLTTVIRNHPEFKKIMNSPD